MSTNKKIKKIKKLKIGKAIYDYFDKVGLENAKYEVSLKIAKKANSTTKYNKSHFSWYKNKYQEIKDIK